MGELTKFEAEEYLAYKKAFPSFPPPTLFTVQPKKVTLNLSRSLFNLLNYF